MPTAEPGPPVTTTRRTLWWERPDLGYDDDGFLRFGGVRVTELARRTGSPAFVYSGARIAANVARLSAVLATLGPPTPRVYYAMKANRFMPVLMQLRELGVGIDVCSPAEVRHALRCGFHETDLSFTAGSLSAADCDALAQWPDLWVNVDSLAAIRHLAAVSPGRRIGLRVNPAAGYGYRANPLVRYAGAAPTKFGVHLDRLAEALELAAKLDLRVEGLHCHAGCGFLTPQLPAVGEVFAQLERFLEAAQQVRRLNLGGGLGIPLVADDAPLDLDAWASLVRTHFGGRGLALAVEPGDYLVKDAGILVTEVTEVEVKAGRVFVGLNAGFNVHPEPVFYDLPLEPAPAVRWRGQSAKVTLTGNLNEAMDLWAEDVVLPPLHERDIVCLLNAGGYGASMSSSHCLRAEFTEHFLPAQLLDRGVPGDLAEANQRAWDRLYGSTAALVWGRAPLPFLSDFVDDFRAALRSPSRLLDAGTGEGRNLPVLRRVGAEELHAIDASPHALEKIPREWRANVVCRRADLGQTGYPDAHFDGIALLDVVETIPNSTTVLRELARILKPGGLLLCNIPGIDDGVAGIDMEAVGKNAFLYRQSYYFQFIERQQAESLLQRCGFEVLRCCRCQWHEPAHPGFRSEPHLHVSHVFLVRRAAAPPGDEGDRRQESAVRRMAAEEGVRSQESGVRRSAAKMRKGIRADAHVRAPIGAREILAEAARTGASLRQFVRLLTPDSWLLTPRRRSVS